MKYKILIYNECEEGKFNKDSRLALTSHVHVRCEGTSARIIKDRLNGYAFLNIEDISELGKVIQAIYGSEFEIQDLRSTA